MNAYNKEDHIKIAKMIRNLKNVYWIVSYDDVDEINKIYNWVKNKLSINLTYTAYKIKRGSEVLFFSDMFLDLDLIE